MLRKKKLSQELLDIYEKLKNKRQLQKVKDRMKSIIKTTVGEHIELERGKEWSYNTHNNTIYYIEEGEQGIKKMPTSDVIAIMLHEISHAKYSEEIKRVSFPDPKRAYAAMVNATEDVRVENKLMRRFPGTYDTFEENMYNSEKFLNADKVRLLPSHLNLLLNYIRKKWNMPTIFSSTIVENIFNKIEPLLDEAVLKEDTNEMEEYLYSEVWKYIEDIIPPPDPNPPQKENEDNENEKGEKPESNKGEEPESNGEKNKQKKKEEKKQNENEKKEHKENEKEKSEEKKKKEQQKDKKFKDKTNNLIDMDEIQNLLHNKQQEKEQPISMFDEADEELSQDKNIHGLQDNDFKPPTKPGSAHCLEKFKTYEEMYADIAHFIPYFVKKINSIMTDNKLSRTGGAYRSGKLNTKTLYKWKCNNPKLFKRKVMRQHKNYSVYLLIDQSGSMTDNNKNINAAKAGILMAEVLKKSGIDFAIKGFNLKHKIYKTFNQPYNWTVKRNLERIIPSTYIGGAGGNNDGYNINRASYELSKRTGEKILIVISDGQPNANWANIPQEDIQRLKNNYHHYREFKLEEEITKAKQNNILIGVGINAPYVADFYPQAILCDNIEELPNQLLNILRKNIRRG